MTKLTTAYHAALPTNVVAALQANGTPSANVFIIAKDWYFVVETRAIDYSSNHGNHKTINHKTIEGAIKQAIELLPRKCDFGFHINPTLIHLLPEEWVNAETSPVIKFEVGKSYLDSVGVAHTITKRSVNTAYHTRPPLVELFESKNSIHYELIQYNMGVEICKTNHSIHDSPTLSADNPQLTS